ncbi:unnamed protein product [Bursaphelenchus okinawaensis]|uniref:Uncharacterized protein n=1 Tax=Bursaphelenchus okinawaensis TaxID=465554 RepID=A0A811JQE8_9BILA|nr:unnamed protein product [Bursaphelenchus okinawaensis]CAG9077157.1 unnamed protein product [Bursaphelenchus okinawaensis]
MRLLLFVLLITCLCNHVTAQNRDDTLVSAEQVRDQMCPWCATIDSHDFKEVFIVTSDNGDRAGYYLRVSIDTEGWAEESTSMQRNDADFAMLLYPIVERTINGNYQFSKWVFWRSPVQNITMNQFTGDRDPQRYLHVDSLPKATGKEFFVLDYYVLNATHALKVMDLVNEEAPDKGTLTIVPTESIVPTEQKDRLKEFLFHLKVCFEDHGFSCASNVDDPYDIKVMLGRENPLYYRNHVFVYARCWTSRCGYYVYDDRYHVDQYVPDTIQYSDSSAPSPRLIRAMLPRIRPNDTYFD